jgi:glutathione S-transferase
MKLLGAAASPFVRKVRILALELGVELAVQNIATATDEALPDANPLAKIPTLLRDDGPPLFDSPVICEFVESRAGGPTPDSGEARWRALTLQALADGLCDAAVWRRGELARPDGDGHPDTLAKEARRVVRALDALEAQARGFTAFGIGEIAAACALAYLDFRFPRNPWRPSRPQLAAWFETISRRPSMQATAPV